MLGVEMLNGIGKGHTALIIGGGMSVLSYPFEELDDDIVRIGINESAVEAPTRVDYCFYNDPYFSERVDVQKLSEKMMVICTDSGFAVSGVSYKCSHDFFMKLGHHVLHGHGNTGAKAIIIAKKIMQFDKIYLIGIDGKCDENGQSHFHGDEKYGNLIEIHKRDLSERFHMEFDSIKNTCENVFNCYRESAVKAFPYKSIKEN
jgi:hypothetical protein